MNFSADFDHELTEMTECLSFCNNNYNLTHETITVLKKKKYIKFVNEDDLDEDIPCQLMIQYFNNRNFRVIFHNPNYNLPEKIYDDKISNKQLIERYDQYKALWIECIVPFSDPDLQIKLQYHWN